CVPYTVRSIARLYTLSLHDALPIWSAIKIRVEYILACVGTATVAALARFVPQDKETVAIGYALIVVTLLAVSLRTGLKNRQQRKDRKSTRLNSSHLVISYAVFCLKK